MLKTAIPSTFPRAGIYEYSTVHVDLACASAGAVIYYTLDGSEPAENGIIYKRSNGLIPLPQDPEKEKIYKLRTFACSEGREPSCTVTYTFRIIGRQHGRYLHQFMREPSADTLGIVRIEDYDLDKMFLIIGSKRAVLIDAGWDYEGDLPALCSSLCGGLPVDLIVAHGHPDHVAQVANFLKSGSRVYLPHADVEMASAFVDGLTCEQVSDIKTGDIIDLGNGALKAFTIPGHTPGGVVLLDEKTGDLFSSDEFGSNRRYVPDSAFLQISDCSVESCLDTLRSFRAATAGQVKRIYTGHNDDVLDAEGYLDCLEEAFALVEKYGNTALSPSLRSSSESFGSGTIASNGDWRYDPFWVAANIKFLTEADRLANPPKYADGYTLPEHPVF